MFARMLELQNTEARTDVMTLELRHILEGRKVIVTRACIGNIPVFVDSSSTVGRLRR